MNRSEGVSLAFRDLLLGVIGLFVMIIVALSLWVNEPQEKQDNQKPPGDLIVSTFWPEGNIDVDLWLTAPGEAKPVGFSNLQGTVWNLLRDDRGTDNDLLPLNYENAYSRGAPSGNYSIMVYCFNCYSPVDVIVKLEQRQGNSVISIVEKKIHLKGRNDWKTFVNFTINEKGEIKNINYEQKSLLQ